MRVLDELLNMHETLALIIGVFAGTVGLVPVALVYPVSYIISL